MEKLTKTQRLILKDIFKAGGRIDSYTLFRRYYITPSQLAASVQRFIKNKHMTFNEGVFALTKQGRKWLVEGSFIVETEDYEWKRVPDSFTQVQLPPWMPYVPELKLLAKSFEVE